MREIVIHTLKKTDVSIEALYELYKESFQQWHEKDIAASFINKTFEEFKEVVDNANVFVALDAKTQELLGMHCFLFRKRDGQAFGFFLAISPKAMHEGIASRMLAHETGIFQKHGYRYLQGTTNAAATWSVRWHLKNGYRIIGYSRSESNNYASYTFRKQFAYDLRHHPTDILWLPCIAPVTSRLTYAATYLVTHLCKARTGNLNALGRLAKRLRR